MVVDSVTKAEIIGLYVLIRSIFKNVRTVSTQLLELYTQRVKKCYENLICSTIVSINEILIIFEFFQYLHKSAIFTLCRCSHNQV